MNAKYYIVLDKKTYEAIGVVIAESIAQVKESINYHDAIVKVFPQGASYALKGKIVSINKYRQLEFK